MSPQAQKWLSWRTIAKDLGVGIGYGAKNSRAACQKRLRSEFRAWSGRASCLSITPLTCRRAFSFSTLPVRLGLSLGF